MAPIAPRPRWCAGGGFIVSILLGFLGAFVGTWLARMLRPPALFSVAVAGRGLPILWSVVGGLLLVLLAHALTRPDWAADGASNPTVRAIEADRRRRRTAGAPAKPYGHGFVAGQWVGLLLDSWQQTETQSLSVTTSVAVLPLTRARSLVRV